MPVEPAAKPAPTAATEYNFDGLVGPSHHYAGLSSGNIASAANGNSVANPRAAALQGLLKMRELARRGFAQGVLPPQMRPDLQLLRSVGFAGADADVIASAHRDAPMLLAAAYSAAPMWSANAATVSPAADTADGRTHFTVANLNSKLHRSREHLQTRRLLEMLFADAGHFAVHPALPGTPALADEGAANHGRLCASHGAPGVELFVYGRAEFDATVMPPRRFPARQTREASAAVARLHGLSPRRTVYLQQNPDVIDQGVFHNDVIAVANGPVLFHHEQAFVDGAQALARLQQALDTVDTALVSVQVPTSAVSVADAVGSYLFNSQLLTRADGGMTLVVPQECRENPAVAAYLDGLSDSGGPISEVCSFDLRQSMRNGGGPACLRLRVVLTETQARAVHPGVLMTDALHDRLAAWVAHHYRDRLAPADLADPALAIEMRTALEALAPILGLPALYAD